MPFRMTAVIPEATTGIDLSRSDMLPEWSRWAWLRSTALGASRLNKEASRSDGMRSFR